MSVILQVKGGFKLDLYHKIADGVTNLLLIIIFTAIAYELWGLAKEDICFGVIALVGIASLLGALLVCKKNRNEC